MAAPPSPALSASQLATLAGLGEERTADVGDVLYRLGEATYPFIAIREGEVAILDAAGNEIVRHGASGFLGELNLLSGQTVFVTAVVTKPLRYIAVDRDALRQALASTNMRTVSGPLRFRADGTAEISGVFIQWQKGKQHLIWPKENATALFAYPALPFNQR